MRGDSTAVWYDFSVEQRPGRIRIFAERDEAICLWLPFAFLLFVALFSLLGWKLTEHNLENWLRFISATIFLEIVHNIFSFFILFQFPEARNWIHDRPRRQRVTLWLRWAVYFSSMVLFLKAGIHWLNSLFEPFPAGLWIAAAMKYVSASHHVVTQISGLSLIYNRELERFPLTADQRRTLRNCEQRERILFRALTITFGAMIMFFTLMPKYPIAKFIPLFGIPLTLLSTALLVNSLSYPLAGSSNKSFYLARIFFFPLGSVVTVATLAGPFLHGVEFLFVTRKMYGRSELRNKATLGTGAAFLGMVALVSVLTLASSSSGIKWILDRRFPDYVELFNWMAAFSTSITYMHFYMDRKMFRMKDPLARKHFGPLLLSGSLSSGPS